MVTVLVVPGGAGSIGIVESLLEVEDCEVIAGDLDPHAPALLRDGVTGYELPRIDREDEYVARLGEIVELEDVDVLIPGYDLDVVAVSKRRDDIPDGVSYLLPDHEKIAITNDTLQSVHVAQRAGVPVPDTYGTLAEYRRAGAAGPDFPLFLKPRTSRGAKGATRVDTERELDYVFEHIAAQWNQPVVQEYIPAETGAMHVVGLLYDRGGNLNSSFVCHSLRTNFSWGGGGVVGEPVLKPELVEYATRVVDELGGWIGPINMEFLVDERDGTPTFMEINPRLWGYNYIATMNGMDLPRKIVRMCQGESVPPQQTYETDTVLMIDFDEVIVSENR